MKTKNKGTGAVTLLELVLVTSIFAVVSMGIAASFLSGLTIWNRARNSGLSRYEMELVLASIGKELREGTGIPDIQFSGTQEEFSFPGLAGDAIVKISYVFNPHDKSFVRRSAFLKDIRAGQEKNSAQEKKLPSLKSFSVSYFYFDKEKGQYLWRDDWIEEKGAWSAIKLHAVYEGNEFNSTVFLPASK